MSFVRLLLSALALGLSGCSIAVDPSYKFNNLEPQGYQASPRDEYRSGFDIGSRDASYGYPSNAHRAYERFGHGLEQPFQDGYADGYARHASKY